MELSNGNPFLPGAASLLNDIDKLMMITLRDGKVYIGYLRTLDQFANFVLHKTIQRIFVGNKFCDIYCGIVIIRGENVVLVAEIDPDYQVDEEPTLERVNESEITMLQRREREREETRVARSRDLFRKTGIRDQQGRLTFWPDEA